MKQQSLRVAGVAFLLILDACVAQKESAILEGGGISQIGGVLLDLPPCQVEQGTILHSDRSCVFIAESASDKKRYQDDVKIFGDIQPAQSNATGYNKGGTRGGSTTRGGGGDVTGLGGSGVSGDEEYEKGERYWLVPPFMIGASSVIVVYIVMHCIYLHCYAKRKMKQLSTRTATPPAIIFSDGPSTSSVHAFTPLVRYESSDGKSEMVETQPYFVYQSPESTTHSTTPDLNASRRPSRRKSSYLQLPNFFGRKGSGRPSVCSAGAALESTPTTAGDIPPPESRQEQRRPRASICFVPVSRTISDPTGGAVHAQEWMPMQGFVYPSLLVPSNNSLSVPTTSSFGSVANREDGVTPPTATNNAQPFFFVPGTPVSSSSTSTGNNKEQGGPGQDPPESSSRSPKSKLPTSASSGGEIPMRKTSFRDPECDMVTIEVPSDEERDSSD